MSKKTEVRVGSARDWTRCSGQFWFLLAAPHPPVSRSPERRWLSEENER